MDLKQNKFIEENKKPFNAIPGRHEMFLRELNQIDIERDI